VRCSLHERTGLLFTTAVDLRLSPVGLATMFYCLAFETSLFAASDDAHCYGGGIRLCLHTG
jgi:hypothetical protein